jgi:hypothetical protein
MSYYSRWCVSLLKTMVEESSVVVLTGPRQVGKSTLLRHEFNDTFTFFDLDDLDTMTQFQQDAESLLRPYTRIVIDEAQRSPNCFMTVKKLVDQNPERRFILSGSANLLLMAQTGESLAGRAQFLHLMPMTHGELNQRPQPEWLLDLLQSGHFKHPPGTPNPKPVSEENVWQGGMPVCLHRQQPDSLTRWREGYIESYLERDLRQLSMIDSLIDFRRLMKLSACRNAQLVNKSEVARDASLSQPTAHRYLNLLETSEWTYSLPAFITNRSQRMVKSPKHHWFDTGIAAHVQGHFSPDDIAASREWGGLWETWVINQIRPLCQLLTPRADLFHWRLRSGAEIDAVIQRGAVTIAIEIKSATTVRYRDTQALQLFLETHPDCCCGLVFYSGTTLQPLTDKIWAVPVNYLWGKSS